MKTILPAVAAALTLFWAQDKLKAPARPEVGKKAPVIRLNDESGKAVTLGGDNMEGWAVLAFFPKAATPG